MSDGVTHAAIAMDSTNAKLFVCGGYLGGNPGPATAKCFVYQSSSDTWTPLPDLPSPRGGGGLVYSQSMNALIFSSGAQRVQVGEQESMDFVDAWMLNLTSGSNTWIAVANSLLLANHISSVTGVDGSGMEHYYFLGGQAKENEEMGNKDQMEEYLSATDTWTSRKAMDMKRGHSNAATIPYQCGILIAGGSINGTVPRQSLFQVVWEFFKGIWSSFWGLFLTRSTTNDEPSVTAVFKQGPTPTVRRATTADVSFYDIATDTWTVIGELNAKAKTVVCDIKDDYLYCGTGGTDEFFRRKLSA